MCYKCHRILKTKEWNDNEFKDVRFLYNEIVTNAFEHGLKNITDGQVKIKMTLTPAYMKLEVTDNGKGFDLNQELEPLTKKYNEDNFVFTGYKYSEEIKILSPRDKN